MNFTKSKVHLLSHTRAPLWAQNSDFQLAKDHITYPAIKIDKTPGSIYHFNYPPIIAKMISELETWGNLPLYLLGRCYLFKIVTFLKLLYPLQTIPLLLKHKDMQAIHKARIALKKMIPPFIGRRGKPPQYLTLQLGSLVQSGYRLVGQ